MSEETNKLNKDVTSLLDIIQIAIDNPTKFKETYTSIEDLHKIYAYGISNRYQIKKISGWDAGYRTSKEGWAIIDTEVVEYKEDLFETRNQRAIYWDTTKYLIQALHSFLNSKHYKADNYPPHVQFHDYIIDQETELVDGITKRQLVHALVHSKFW